MGTWRGVELEGLRLAEPPPGGLRLRPYRPSDVPAVAAGMAGPDTHRFLALPRPYTEADARDFCSERARAGAAAGTRLEWAVTDGDDVVVGGAGVSLPPPGRPAEIGYVVYPGARGRGLAARATRVIAAWAFAHGVDRVELHIAVDNVASARSALRAGFRFETVARRGMGVTDGVVDAAVFARISTDDGEPVPPWLPPLITADGTPLGDDVVTLRVLEPDDHPVIAEDVTEPEARRWAVGDPCEDPDVFARDRARVAGLRWLVGPATRIAVVDRASGRVAAVVELRRAGPPEVVEVGYFVRAPFRGRGTTVRALALLRDWAFGPAGIARLELGADADNLASHTVATRAGFVREGVFPGRLRHPEGGYRDEVRFGLTR